MLWGRCCFCFYVFFWGGFSGILIMLLKSEGFFFKYEARMEKLPPGGPYDDYIRRPQNDYRVHEEC